TRFCENYASCLHNLENAQRTCPEFNNKIDNFEENASCNITKRRLIAEEIANLQLRRTEVIQDCVKKNSLNGISFLSFHQEHRCLNKADKVKKYVSSHGSESSHDHLTKRKKRKKKQQTNECHRQRKFLHAKCDQIAMCCSISMDCHLSARLIQQQINDLKKELKALKKDCQKS
uniref:Uncharacterized protein n=1 Tax=Acrobeloides nanus TaxID=290746 RepID=A0A914D3E4_9BILA